MSKIPYIHYSKDKNNLINLYYMALGILIIFSIYKNGILLYQNNLIHLTSIFSLFYFYITSILISILAAYLLKASYKETILLGLIVTCSISINTNKLIFPILLFVAIFISKYLKEKKNYFIHTSAFTRVLLILGVLIGNYSYLNVGEKLGKFNYSLLDIFLGFGPGGLATTSFMLILFCFLILASNRFYKKNIFLSATISFLALNAIYVLITKDISFLEKTLNGTVYYSFLFFAPSLNCTPYREKNMITYGSLIGIISFILSLIFNIYEAGILSVFIVSLLMLLYNNFHFLKN